MCHSSPDVVVEYAENKKSPFPALVSSLRHIHVPSRVIFNFSVHFFFLVASGLHSSNTE